ncbi:MAG: MBL fold metallo-hydrolase [Clostridia bacterium]|nr:MBL fold metallo-hydrolase [Clostridia bacterium]
MQLTFLGTGARDFTIEDRGTSGFRFWSGALLGEDTLIDCGPYLFEAAADAGVDLSKVRYVIVTHRHVDHFSLKSLRKLAENQPITICIHENSTHSLSDIPNLTVVPLSLFAHTALRDMALVAMPANHSVSPTSCEQPVHYVIYREGRTLFWGCDGAWMLNATWHAIKNMRFNLMVLDGTLGEVEGDNRIFEHNNLRMVHEMAKTFTAQGMIAEGGSIMISHLSKFEHTDKETLDRNLAQKGLVKAAYDGLRVTV